MNIQKNHMITEYKLTEDAVLVVLASDIYKAEHYIRNYNDYLERVTEQ